MNIQCHSKFKGLRKVAERLVNSNGKASDLLRDATLMIGPASDPAYGVPANAVYNPTFVGDHAMMGDLRGSNSQIEAMYKKNPESVNLRPVFNPKTAKYDFMVSKAASFVGDSGELIAAQQIAPWNASYFPKIFRQPLLYSHARNLVKRMAGSNPWGEVQSLILAAYSGWGQIGEAGTVAANMKKNVNVQNGMMTSDIINLKVFFNFTTEEIERSKDSNGSPFAGSLMAEKQRYAQYVLDMMTDYLTYYGNADTDTLGLLNVNGITTYNGNSLAQIAADSNNAAKGSAMYQALAKLVSDFMGASQNKFDVVRVAMAPAAYNILTSTPYSDVYSGESPLATFEQNFKAGMSKNGTTPKIELYSDPMLAADTVFNPTGNDYVVITAPEIGAGTEDEKQDLVLLGVPLENFAYPVYPNSYDQQHCVLRRFSGVFAPVGSAVKVYSGFGVKAA